VGKTLRTGSALLLIWLLCTASAFAQSPNKEPKEVAVVELGGAAERSLTEGNSSFGPTAAVEFTPIEHWLEIEAGVTPLFRRHSTEWSVDLLFKKPWTISSKFEFMLGVGPEWTQTSAVSRRTPSASNSPPILCSGRQRGINSGGIWNRATTTSSDLRMNIRLA